MASEQQKAEEAKKKAEEESHPCANCKATAKTKCSNCHQVWLTLKFYFIIIIDRFELSSHYISYGKLSWLWLTLGQSLGLTNFKILQVSNVKNYLFNIRLYIRLDSTLVLTNLKMLQAFDVKHYLFNIGLYLY